MPYPVVGRLYKCKHQSDILRYIGVDRCWYQFEKVDAPGRVWCEVLFSDLQYFEEVPCEVS